MTLAKKENVNVVEIICISEAQVGLTDQSSVDITQSVAGIALRVDKDYLSLGMIDSQTDEFAGCVAGSSDDADFHFASSAPLRF